METISIEINHNSEKQVETNKIYEYNLLELEKKYDTKLIVFMSSYKAQFGKDLKNLHDRFSSKINDIQKAIGAFKIIVQNQLNDFKKKKKVGKQNILRGKRRSKQLSLKSKAQPT